MGVTDRTMRRWRERLDEARLQRFVGLPQDAARARSECRWRRLEQVLQLYREKYFDFNVRHFHEKLREVHGIASQLHVGEDGLQRGGPGEEAEEAGIASQATTAPAVAGNDAAHRWQ